MIIPLLAALFVVSPALFGGSLRRFGDLQIRSAWIIPVTLAAQIVALEVLSHSAPAVLAGIHIATYLGAGWFVWLNREIPGLWLIALGAASNGVTIAANGGTLPASEAALRTAGREVHKTEFVNSGVLPDPHLSFLGDVFAIPAGVPLANVFSIGDLLILGGVAWGSHRIAGSRLTPAWQMSATRPEKYVGRHRAGKVPQPAGA